MGFLQSFIFAAGLMTVSDTAPSESVATSMERYIWKSRPLIIFTPGPGNPLLSAQREILDQRGDAFRDRDMILVAVVGDTVTINGRAARGLRADDLRARYQVDSKTQRALLVGKDGGVKLSSDTAFPADKLFATIDAMPMRQHEMRQP